MGTTEGRWEGDVACRQGHRENRVKNLQGLVEMGMSRCSKEAARRGSDRTGTRSCVQKEQWSPQEWADRAKQSQ